MAFEKNTDRLSEFAKIYYQITSYDLGQGDDTILLDSSWIELCAISVGPSSNVNNYEVKDRCVGKVVGNVPGREGFTFDLSMNMFRQNPAFGLKAWNTAMDNGDIVAFLILNDNRLEDDDPADVANTTVWGRVGNFVRIDESEDQPEEGLIVINYTFGPAAAAPEPLMRRIYGSGIS